MNKKNLVEYIAALLGEYFSPQNSIEKVSGIYRYVMQEVERILISKVMHLTHYNKKLSAQILGISRNTLNSKIKLLHLSYKL